MENKTLPLAELKKIVEDCFSPNPWIYWLDLLACAVVAYGSFYLTELSPALSAMEFIYFGLSMLAFYRGVLFIHELTHQERRALPGFSIAWNLLFGVPLLFPSFMYRGVHIDHHRKHSYGTVEDGEYVAFGASPFWKTLFYLGQSILLPFLILFRFGILTPVSYLHPRLRAYVMAHCSALAIRFDSMRKIPTGEDLRRWYALEALCFVWIALMTAVFSSGLLGLGTLRHIYLLMVAVFFVNSLRTIVAHRYRNLSGKELSYSDQFLDSVNIEGNPLLVELLAPVGLRYHALHHLFPSIPYHQMGTAHRRLRELLPANSLYHSACEPSLWSALLTHWHNTQSAPQGEEPASGSARV